MICYGVPVGTETYVRYMLNEKINKLSQEVEIVCQTLEEERHSLWAVLRSSLSQKLDYWLTLVYPSLVREAATRMDRLMTNVLDKLLGTSIPMEGEGLGWIAPCMYL